MKRSNTLPDALHAAAGAQTALPLTFQQEEQLRSSRSQAQVGNRVACWRFVGTLDLQALAGGVNRVVERHEVLRARFVADGETSGQVIVGSANVQVQVLDRESVQACARQGEISKTVQAEARHTFDVGGAPLLRVQVLRFAATEHVLVLTMHPLIADQESLALFMREVAALYQGAVTGDATPLHNLTHQYSDFSQLQSHANKQASAQLAYWQQELQNVPVALALPTDRVRPAQSSGQGRRLELVIPPAQIGALQKGAAQEASELALTLLAGWALLLHRYSGQEELLVGVPISKRSEPDFADLIGPCAQVVPLTFAFGETTTFRDLLRRAQQALVEAQAHQDVSCAQMTEQATAWPVRFVWQEDKQSDLQWSQLVVERLLPDTELAECDLTLEMVHAEKGMQAAFVYSTDLFDEATIRRMAAHFLRLLEGAVQEPDRPVCQLAMLSEQEIEQQLVEWNNTAAAYPRDACVYELVQRQAAERPEALAAVSGNESISYGELNRRANQLARYLRRLGVGPDVPVGLCVQRSLDMLVGMYAVLKAGGAYVPMDPAHPQERLAYMVADTRVPVVLTQDALRGLLPQEGAQLFCLDTQWAEVAGESTDDLEPLSTPDNIAYIIYTSGSTGKPKGVQITHGSLLNLIFWHLRYYELTASDRTTQVAGTGFDVAVWEIWPTWVAGATLHVADDETRLSLHRLQEWLLRHEITVGFVPTPLAEGLIDLPWPEQVPLRYLLTAGDKLHRHPRPGLPFVLTNNYGPTETTVIVTAAPVPEMAVSERAPSIGRPIDNTRAYVLDRHLQLVPVGVAGELHIGGVNVGRGYLGRPDLTAEKFIPDPFAAEPGARMYKTGDLVRYRPDGEIEYLGRIDHQVKIRGLRIELGEIETVLGQHPGVREVVVLTKEAPSGDLRLVAYLVPNGEQEPTAAELQAFLQQSLPAYMVPAAFVFLAEFPLNRNGKVDRNALPTPQFADTDAKAYVAPQTPEEEVLAGIWAQALGVERVGRHDHFFHLGGHSLIAMKVAATIRQQFAVDITLATLFAAPTLAELAAAITAQTNAQQDAPIVALGSTGDLPLSSAQRRIWFFYQLEPESVVYNLPFAYRINGPLDAPLLERCLNELIRRHRQLRMTFPLVGSEPVQRELPEVTLALPVIDLQQLPESERADASLKLMQEAGRVPFQLEQGPLVRANLYRLQAEEHGLLLHVHHIVTDGWSMEILLRELIELYTAYQKGNASPLPALPVEYTDYSEWQHQQLQGERLERQLAYWQEQLAGVLTVFELPTDFPRPPVQSHQGVRHAFTLPTALAESLHKLSRAEGVTLFMTLLAAWSTLLYRYTGQEDFLIGSPIANRNRSEIEGVVGFFINTLALRMDLTDAPSFRELLQRVREVALGAFAHQDLPFEKVVEALQPERSRSHAPLCQVLFVLQSDYTADLKQSDLTVRYAEVDTGTAKFDLWLEMVETQQGLSGVLEYSTDLFAEATIARMVGHFTTLLSDLVAAPERPVTTAALLTEAERRQLLVEWNDTATEYPRDACVYELVQRQAAERAEALAAVSDSESITYGELNSRANQLARYLRRRGVGPDVPVGLCVQRSIDMLVGMYAVLKAGGAYVPMDPAHPLERLAYMVTDTRVPVVLTQDALRGLLPQDGVQLFCLDTQWAEVADECTDDLEPLATTDDLAYIIYTSGSTGRPKGVQITHGSLLNLIFWHLRCYEVTANDHITQVAGTGFDVAVWEIWPTFVVGAVLHVCDDETRLSLHRLQEWLLRHQITIGVVPTPLAEGLIDLPWPEQVPLRYLLTIGDKLRRHPRPGLPFVFTNNYGPTETTVTVTAGVVPEMELSERAPTIGRPIDNTRAYVLDRHLQLVPIGVVGELHIGGVQVGRGYLGRPELTAEKFIPDPFVDESGARMYKTGDLVRYLPNGELEFLGRIDHQVKIRGLRIELGEIETVLGQHPSVREVVVLTKEAPSGDQRLVAYLLSNGEQEPTAAELQALLQQSLPAYMVPEAFVFMTEFPLNRNGKVDRKALPTPQFVEAGLHAYEPPQTPEEEVLAGIWAQALGVERVGRHDHFFQLGGHSLIAMKVAATVRQQFAVDITLAMLFDAPTLAELAAVITARTNQQQDAPIVALGKVGDLPLSSAQRRIWFFYQLEPASALYNLPFAYRITGPLDVHVLERCLNELIRRHRQLRMTFPLVGSEPVQRELPELTLALPVIDLQHLPEPERADASLQLMQEAGRVPFVLEKGPLVRAQVYRLQAEEHDLLLHLHHIVTDGWSMEILLRELIELYSADQKGNAAPLPALPVEYTDYSEWQQQQLQGEQLKRQLAYWQEQLAGAPTVLELPTDFSRPPVQSHQGRQHAFTLPPALVPSLHQLCRAEGVTLFMTLLAAWSTLLYRYTGQEDFLIGSPIANRNRSEIEGVVGFFVNTLALRMNLTDAPSFRELLQRVREVALGAFAHQDLPFEKVVDTLQPERSRSHAPLCQVVFVLQSDSTADLKESDLTVHYKEVGTGTAKFDLMLEMVETQQGLSAVLEYSTDLFTEATMARMVGHFTTLLSDLVAAPERPVTTAALLTEAERKQLLTEWNDTRTDYPRTACVHQLFEAQAAQTPDAVALVCASGTLTYRELNERANQVAHRLQKLGVGQQTFVGISMERSAELIVGLLAILKAGGVYVPLDPSYPQERLTMMLEDTQVPVLLTQQSFLRQWQQIAGEHAQIVCLDAQSSAEESVDNLPGVATADGLAYVVFTSGSTGRPKGVCVPHRGVVRLVKANHFAALTADEVILQFAPVAFDASTFEIWGALLNGGRLAVFPPHMPTVEELGRFIREQGVTTLWLTAGLFQLMAEREAAAFAGVRQLLAGGDVLSAPHVRQVLAACPGLTLINGYGPTENTTFTCCYPMTVVEQVGTAVPIGYPIANTQLYVLDRQQQLVPIGVPGELYVGGDGLAVGYLGRPELTAEKFVANPFAAGEKLYRTGDLVRWRQDGVIEFLGRIDNQIKLRGFRIELGEIEAVLSGHPAVQEATVIAQEFAPGDLRLVAYFTASGEAEAEGGELRRYVKERLPEFMVPVAFLQLDTMPLTTNGKLDRRALPKLEAAQMQATAEFVAPRTETETALAGLFGAILQVEAIGVQDNLFELGANSLLLSRAAAQIRDQFQANISVGALFEAPTVAELAQLVDAAERVNLQRITRYQEEVAAAGWEEADAEQAQDLLADLADLSDDDVEDLFQKLLAEEDADHE